jgi:predicted outer membrane repeat protein
LGGAIFSDELGTLTVSNSVFSANSGHQSGGAIYSNGALSVETSRFLRNRASLTDGSGGAIYIDDDASSLSDTVFTANQAYSGAAVYNVNRLTVDRSTFSQNRSMYLGGGIASTGIATVTNSTFYANLAISYGGGIWNGSQLTVTNSTFSENSSSNGSSISNDGEMYLYNSILANSISGAECDSTASLGSYYNLIEDGSCGAYLAVDPRLGPLANNGGLTPTMALPSGSAAIDAGDASTCPSTDQRGTVRPQGSLCDIGAYEKKP